MDDHAVASAGTYATTVRTLSDAEVSVLSRSPAHEFVAKLAAGALSYPEGEITFERGFFPTQPPNQKLPATHQEWLDVANNLPALIKSPRCRARLREMPLLDATEAALESQYLPLAATSLGVLAHVYWNVTGSAVKPQLPDCIAVPWRAVCARLQRPDGFNFTLGDLHLGNWKLIDPEKPEPFHIENMQQLVVISGTQAERMFFLIFAEMAYQAKDIVQVVVAAQDVVVAGDEAALIEQLRHLMDMLERLGQSFMKASINEYSSTYIDPYVLARVATSMVVPTAEVHSTISGLFSPFFLILDYFMGRIQFETTISKELLAGLPYMPKIYRDFFAEVQKIDTAAFVADCDNETLKSVYAQFCQKYAGPGGFLEVHRDKVWGVISVAINTGRRETVAGLKFTDPLRTIIQNLDRSSRERPQPPIMKTVARLRSVHTDSKAVMPISGGRGRDHLVAAEVPDTLGLKPGDKLSLLLENTPSKIEAILARLGLSSVLQIPLNDEWRRFLVENKAEVVTDDAVQLAVLLRYANIKKLRSDVVLSLVPELRLQLAYTKDAVPAVFDLAELLAVFEERFQKALRERLKARLFVVDGICDLLSPMGDRTYSLSELPASTEGGVRRIGMTVRRVEFDAASALTGRHISGEGAGSSRLAPRAARKQTVQYEVRAVPGKTFTLPDDKLKRPVVMIATGSGISPFRSFWRANVGVSVRPMYLFYGVQTAREVAYPGELATAETGYNMQVFYAYSRGKDGKRITAVIEEQAELLTTLLFPEQGKPARIFICGQPGLFRDLTGILINIMKQHFSAKAVANPQQAAETIFYRLCADNVIVAETFTDIAQRPKGVFYSLRDVVDHNTAATGRRCIFSGKVYGLDEYMPLHPGGQALLRLHSGTDVSVVFHAIRGHTRTKAPESMLSQYCLGDLQEPSFEDIAMARYYEAMKALLFCVVKQENLLALDYRIPDRAHYVFIIKAISAHDRFRTFSLGKINDHFAAVTEHAAAIAEQLQPLLDAIQGYLAQTIDCPYHIDELGEVATDDTDAVISAKLLVYVEQLQQLDQAFIGSLKEVVLMQLEAIAATASTESDKLAIALH